MAAKTINNISMISAQKDLQRQINNLEVFVVVGLLHPDEGAHPHINRPNGCECIELADLPFTSPEREEKRTSPLRCYSAQIGISERIRFERMYRRRCKVALTVSYSYITIMATLATLTQEALFAPYTLSRMLPLYGPWNRLDLNQGPPRYECGALTI